MTVSLVLPTMNELEGLRWFMPQIDRSWFDEIIVSDGGSTDGTLEYCREQGCNAFVQHERGLPAALSEALDRVRTDIVITMSPDGNCKPEHVPELIEEMKKGYDLVIVSRYFGGAKSEDDDFLTGLGNQMFTRTVNLLFRGNYTDTLGIYRAYRREAIDRMRLVGMHRQSWLRRHFANMNSMEFGSSIRAAKLRLNVKEFGGDEPKRVGGIRKLSIWNNGMGAVFQIGAELLGV